MSDRGDPDEDGRGETANQRMDRNWNELLQELRVTQTGTQVLTGFLLAVAFQPSFRDLDGSRLVVYLALVAVAVLTTAVALTPVILHRTLFRRGVKAAVVQWGHALLLVALAGVALVLIGTVTLIFDVALGPPWGAVAGVAMLALVLGMGLMPRFLRGRLPS